jgi:hypothetical protein
VWFVVQYVRAEDSAPKRNVQKERMGTEKPVKPMSVFAVTLLLARDEPIEDESNTILCLLERSINQKKELLTQL